jgi:hypothetical protein
MDSTGHIPFILEIYIEKYIIGKKETFEEFPFYFVLICYNSNEKGEETMYTVLVVCVIIVVIVLLLAALTTSKAYSYKHTVDPIENNPHLNQEHRETEEMKEK